MASPTPAILVIVDTLQTLKDLRVQNDSYEDRERDPCNSVIVVEKTDVPRPLYVDQRGTVSHEYVYSGFG